MRTLSHVLITTSLGAALRARQVDVDQRAFLAGAALPDLPLAALAGAYKAVRALRGARSNDPEAPTDRFDVGCHDRFFNDPLWIASYGIPHAPAVIAALWLAGRGTGRGDLRWLAAGLALHSAIDVLTHHDDGPLLLFPLDWRRRWRSPVSYWDRAHHGSAFTVFEYGLDLLLLGALALKGVHTWRARNA